MTPPQHVTWPGIKEWLPTIILILTLVIGGATTYAKIGEIDGRVNEDHAALKVCNETQTQILIALARIETDISHIREQLTKQAD